MVSGALNSLHDTGIFQAGDKLNLHLVCVLIRWFITEYHWHGCACNFTCVSFEVIVKVCSMSDGMWLPHYKFNAYHVEKQQHTLCFFKFAFYLLFYFLCRFAGIFSIIWFF